MNKIDIINKKFGKWTVLEKTAQRANDGGILWLCRCDCGVEKSFLRYKIIKGKIKGCHCDPNMEGVSMNAKHGKRNISEYGVWADMKKRCYNSKSSNFKNYGERGIIVCDKWKHSFENFIKDMGLKPTAKHTLERLENNGNYEPTNCAWKLRDDQANNKRTCHWIEIDGKKLSLKRACKLRNISYGMVQTRLQRGYSVEKAFKNI